MIQCISGHSDILRNQMAEYVAKQACSENAKQPGVTYTAICTRIRHVVNNQSIQHERTALVYSAYNSSKKKLDGKQKRPDSLLAKLRNGK